MEAVSPSAFLFLEPPEPLFVREEDAAEWPMLPGVIGDAIPISIHKKTQNFKSERRKKGPINITDYR